MEAALAAVESSVALQEGGLFDRDLRVLTGGRERTHADFDEASSRGPGTRHWYADRLAGCRRAPGRRPIRSRMRGREISRSGLILV